MYSYSVDKKINVSCALPNFSRNKNISVVAIEIPGGNLNLNMNYAQQAIFNAYILKPFSFI
jgi:hypothetical protein